MLTVARRRPSASLAWATWTSRWVSTPRVTRGRCSCAMVVMPSPFCDQAVDGTRRRAGGQHCNGSGATGSYQVTVARWRCPWRPQRESTGLATRHKASGTTGQTLATTTTARSLQWNNGSDSRHDHHRQIIAVEQDPAPAVQPHLHELAGPAAGVPRGDRRADRRDPDPRRPQDPCRTRPTQLPAGRQDLRPGPGRGAAAPPRLAWGVELHLPPRRRIATPVSKLVARGPLTVPPDSLR